MKSRRGKPDKEKRRGTHGTVRIQSVQSEGEAVAGRGHADPHHQHDSVLGIAERIRLRSGHHPGRDGAGLLFDYLENIEEASLVGSLLQFFRN